MCVCVRKCVCVCFYFIFLFFIFFRNSKNSKMQKQFAIALKKSPKSSKKIAKNSRKLVVPPATCLAYFPAILAQFHHLIRMWKFVNKDNRTQFDKICSSKLWAHTQAKLKCTHSKLNLLVHTHHQLSIHTLNFMCN